MDKRAIFLPAARQIKRILSKGTERLNVIYIAAGLLVAACASPGQDKASSPDPSNDLAALHIATAERLADVGEYDSALQEYLAAAQASSDPEVARMVTRLAGRVQNWPVAATAAARWLELDPAAESAHHVRVIALTNQSEAAEAVEAILAWFDSSGEAAASGGLQRAATLLSAASEADAARRVFDRLIGAVAGSASEAEVAHAESLLLWHQGRLDEARQRAETAIEADANSERLTWAARLAEEDGEPEAALAAYRRARADRREDVGLALAEAEVLRQLERDEEALGVLRELEPDVEALYTLGIYLVQLEREDEAEETWQRLAGIADDDDAEEAFKVAQLAEFIGRDAQALDWYGRIDAGLRLEPAMLRSSVILARDERLDEARDLLRRLRSEAAPEVQHESWLIEAEILRSSGRAQEAIELLAEPLVDRPGSMDLLYARALSAASAGDIDLAEQDLRRIIQMDGENAMALNALGYTLADQTDRYREAYRLIQRALEIDPDDPATLDSMGWVLYRLGRADEAVDYLERALDGDSNPEIMGHLIEVLDHLGREREARELASRARQEYPDSPYVLEAIERLERAP